MKKALILALTGAAAISLAACSENSRTQTEQAADAIAADAKATTQNASDDVEAATARALNSAENTIDRAGDRAAVQADRAGDNIDRGLDRAGDKIERGADNARQATGNALVRAGEDVRR